MARYLHSGNAPETTLVGDISDTAVAITIASGTGYPTGAKFWIVIDPDTASEEHIRINARSGTALTVASVADRGVDNTSAQAHSSGAIVRHIWSAEEATDVALQSVANTYAGKQTFNAHISAAGTAATVSVGAGAGAGASASIVGNDTCGIVTVTTGTGTAAGTELVTVTFATAYTSATGMSIQLTGATNGNAAAADLYALNFAAGSFRVQGNNTPAVSSTIVFSYLVMGGT